MNGTKGARVDERDLLDVDLWKKLAGVDDVKPDPEEALDPDTIVTTSGHVWEVVVTRPIRPFVEKNSQDHVIRLITPTRDIMSVTSTLAATHGEYAACTLVSIAYLGPVSGRGCLVDKDVCAKLLRLVELEILHSDVAAINSVVDKLSPTQRWCILEEIRKNLNVNATSDRDITMVTHTLQQNSGADISVLDGRPPANEKAIATGALPDSVPSQLTMGIDMPKCVIHDGVDCNGAS